MFNIKKAGKHGADESTIKFPEKINRNTFKCKLCSLYGFVCVQELRIERR